MSDDGAERFAGGIAVSVLGMVLGAVTVFDIYEDVVVQGDPLYLTLLENAVPLSFDMALVVVGIALVTGRTRYASSARRITYWTLFGGGALLAITGWVYYFQILQGEFKPHILFSHVVAMGAIAGIAIGVYDGHRTERESELRIERDRTAALFENSSDCIAAVEFVDGEPIIRRVNAAFHRTFGIDTDEAAGRSIDEVIVPSDRDDRTEEINRQAREGTIVEEEVFRRTTSGEIRVFRLQAIPLETDEADTDGYAVYTDITDQHRYEERITALHEATRTLMNADSIEEITDKAVEAASDVLGLTTAGIHLYDAETDRLEPAAWTDQVDDLVGEPDAFERGDAIAWRAFETVETEYVADLSGRSDAHNPDSPMQSEILLPIGEWGVLMVASEAPDAFDDSELSLSRTLAANVEAAMDRADRRRELKRQNERLETFAGVVSHDLRNPLSVARGFLDLARDGEPEALDRIEEALDRMESLIESLLTLARAGEVIGELEQVDIEAAAEAAWRNVDTDGATLSIETDATIRADADRLEQVFENLFRNAVEHGSVSPASQAQQGAGDHPGDGVSVSVRSTPAGFTVDDDGPGIPESERGDIFEYGYTTDAEGTGLGLAIVRQIVEAHGWTVSVGESPEGGARFEFTT